MVYDDQRTAEQFPHPYLSNNGSSANSLILARIAARSAILNAIKALQECAPHGRDYQTAHPAAFAAARRQYEEQYAALAKVADAVYQEAILIQGQVP
jgi:hypothetical protein